LRRRGQLRRLGLPLIRHPHIGPRLRPRSARRTSPSARQQRRAEYCRLIRPCSLPQGGPNSGSKSLR
jgi:hypothetical protein